jgi:hypothetical protein
MDKPTHTNSHIPEVTEKRDNGFYLFYIINEDNDLEKKRNTDTSQTYL